MKISLYTISLSGGYYRGPAVPLLDIFPKARAWGYDGVEIEAKRPHGSPLDLDARARQKIVQVARDNGLELSCLAAYNDFSSPIEEHRENELLMAREQIRLAADLGIPIVRVMAAWSGVTRRDGVITYDVARYNIDHRYPGTIFLERWNYVRDYLIEAAKWAEDMGVVLALQNHAPIITHYKDMLDFIDEVNSPALKACLDAPIMEAHGEAYYRAAITATGNRMVHTHYGGQYKRDKDGRVVRLGGKPHVVTSDDFIFLKLAKEIINFQGHNGYELCSPVVLGHRHQGLDYALDQAKLAAEYMREIINALQPVPA